MTRHKRNLLLPTKEERLSVTAASHAAARTMLRSNATLLAEACGSLAGEAGLALAWACIDIAADTDMPPSAWPLADVLDLLRCGRGEGLQRAYHLVHHVADLVESEAAVLDAIADDAEATG